MGYNSYRELSLEYLLISAFSLPRKSADFYSFPWLENQPILARFYGKKIRYFQLVFLLRKSADFSLFTRLENQLNLARFLGNKIS